MPRTSSLTTPPCGEGERGEGGEREGGRGEGGREGGDCVVAGYINKEQMHVPVRLLQSLGSVCAPLSPV